ncbi:hypothetical protein [Microbacterium sp. CPCC 204701]|uniref:hypothetical protein n=1 Tax=Microbacterium sp. CPCC 204701 TaxID=2493084 RepID=UPI000FD6D3DE|nr:hypothetical protein [Microbacterium sp. CPCC 204701]
MDWRPPAGKGDPIFGAGATTAEKTIANVVGLFGAAIVVAAGLLSGADWNLILYVVAAVIAFDVVGGIPANGLNSAKRDHHGPPSATADTAFGRVVRLPVVFTALHIHPIIVGTFYTPHLWWWGPIWYLVIVSATATVRAVPLHLERPTALGFCAIVTMAAVYLPAPDLWAWLPIMLALKLVLAHAVQEEPYRPVADPAGDSALTGR